MLNVKKFREAHGLSARDVVDIILALHPGYDRYLNSKIENPARYGVRLTSDAEAALKAACSTTASEPLRRDGRRLPCRIQCRMSAPELGRLQQAIKRNGHDTVQAGMAELIEKYLNESETEERD